MLAENRKPLTLSPLDEWGKNGFASGRNGRVFLYAYHRGTRLCLRPVFTSAGIQ